jgi:flagellar basal-body rod protein FlgF/flagellar basal-body rod protein FlgG
MENTLLVGLSRQVALARELEVVANNIANVNTTGFKADNAVFQEFLMPVARENRFNLQDRRLSFVEDRGIWHDMRQGSMQQTGNPLDVAIDGDAYLVVQTAAGERYTRNGSLQINATGQLVTNDGSAVMGENGPITFQQLDRNISITSEGRVSVVEGGDNRNESLRGKLRLVSFAAPQRLLKDGANNFQAPAGVAPEASRTARVIQGSVEKSNVNAVGDMTRMIEITRTYTQISTLLQQQGDMRRSAIEKLAEVPA